MKRKSSIYKIVTVGLLGALVFVSNYLSFPIPVPVGDISRIHLGNVFCLLSGFVMGPVYGGLASGIGAALYDLIRSALRGTCLYRCGNERYLLQVLAPDHKKVLFGTEGGR